jgi:hypothetical protein
VQCHNRWHHILDPNIVRANGRTGKWTADEDSKLRDVVQTHGDMDWVAITELVPGRMDTQCRKRWNEVLGPNIGTVSGRNGSRQTDEDSNLKNPAQTHGDKDWGAIAALVPS